jgi:ferredoxin
MQERCEAAMKLRVDATKCEGYGKCVDVMPDLFVLDDWGYASIEGTGVVPEGQEDLARQAIAVCPAFAILEVEET